LYRTFFGAQPEDGSMKEAEIFCC